MNIIKLVATVSLAVAVITMVTSNQLSIYATPTTEDDGWVEGDDDSQGEISSQEELEEAYEGSQWEDDIGSNEFEEETDNDDENDDELVECEDGSLVETEESCEQSEALVTCSDGSSAATQAECPPEPLVTEITCSDGTLAETQDMCEIPPVSLEELITCSDGTLAETQDMCHLPILSPLVSGCPDVPFYMTCHEPDEKKNDNDNDNDKKVIQKTTVIQSATATANANANANTNAADVSNCKLNGSADGIQQKFNSVRYQACGLYTSAEKAYYDGFVAGCMQVGNTKLICETVANSNIVAPPAQTQTATQPQTQPNTQTAAQPTQAIQPAAPG